MNKKTILQCECGMPEFLVFEQDPDDKTYYVYMVSSNLPFWRKLKNALNYLFRGGELVWDEVIITEKEFKKLSK